MAKAKANHLTVLNPAQAAEHVSLSKRYLAQLRFYGTGPTFEKKRGRISYERTELDSWNADRLARKNARKSRSRAVAA